MATQAEINAHDQLITNLANDFASGIESLLASAVVALSSVDLQDRVAVNAVFDNTRTYINSNIQGLDRLAISNLELNNIEPSNDLAAGVVNLKTASSNAMTVAVDEEVNTVIGELVTAALLGLGVAQIITSLSNRVPAMVTRLRRAYDQTLITFTSVLTKLAGEGQRRFKYAGGLIPTSRPFCSTHDGGIYTDKEITNIWSGSWEGKAPGDPFVVRGGYNCRHFWILEE
jgi:hypothetical protein